MLSCFSCEFLGIGAATTMCDERPEPMKSAAHPLVEPNTLNQSFGAICAVQFDKIVLIHLKCAGYTRRFIDREQTNATLQSMRLPSSRRLPTISVCRIKLSARCRRNCRFNRVTHSEVISEKYKCPITLANRQSKWISHRVEWLRPRLCQRIHHFCSQSSPMPPRTSPSMVAVGLVSSASTAHFPTSGASLPRYPLE